MNNEKTKKTIIERVLEFINGGDEANVKRVLETAENIWTKNISTAERNITTIKRKRDEKLDEFKEYLEEAKIAYKEAFLNIKSEKMSLDQRKAYISNTYQQNIANAKHRVESYKKQIEGVKTKAEDSIKAEQFDIDMYKEYLKEIK